MRSGSFESRAPAQGLVCAVQSRTGHPLEKVSREKKVVGLDFEANVARARAVGVR